MPQESVNPRHDLHTNEQILSGFTPAGTAPATNFMQEWHWERFPTAFYARIHADGGTA